ncbi:phage baseplate assembly protein V [Sphingobium sp. JAI105]|uniref:phage baseplate assembly protein V n=1 Tax=Sphingobium sp. JAI105 TaxID=2787715 RepID=UPI0018CA130E|nr:phage baseplate assembly protein V [Sphingobium sp. JAI105]
MTRAAEDIPADLSELIRLGTIASVDLAAATCTVRYGDPDDDDGGAETPPIRWLAQRAGKTRIWSPPSIGEQALLLVPDGQLAAAVALVGIWQDSFPPPGATLAEMVEYEDGAQIGYDPENHALTAILPDGATALVEAPGGLTIRADVTIEGNVTLTGRMDASDDVTADGISLKTHKHGNVQSGGGQTGDPV